MRSPKGTASQHVYVIDDQAEPIPFRSAGEHNAGWRWKANRPKRRFDLNARLWYGSGMDHTFMLDYLRSQRRVQGNQHPLVRLLVMALLTLLYFAWCR